MKFKQNEEKRRKFVEVLKRKDLEEGEMKIKEMAEEIGISLKTFYRWYSEPELLLSTYKEYFANIELWLPRVLLNLLKKSDERDIKAIRFLIKGFTIYSDGLEKPNGLEKDRIIDIVRRSVVN